MYLFGRIANPELLNLVEERRGGPFKLGFGLSGETELLVAWLRIEEGPVSLAAPEVGENDHTSDRRVCTPKRGECVSL